MLGALQYTGQRKNEHGQRMGEPSSGGVDHDVGGLLALTPLGGRMARLPLSPRHARMLLQVCECVCVCVQCFQCVWCLQLHCVAWCLMLFCFIPKAQDSTITAQLQHNNSTTTSI